MAGIKHLIQCHCVLPQYRNIKDPIFHKFVVFSKTDEDSELIPKLQKCNNCGVIHKIIDFCKSEVSRGVDLIDGISSVDDVRTGLPEKICEILDAHSCDISTWEQIDDIIDNEEWGSQVVISRQALAGSTQVKLLILKGSDSFKIETNFRQDDIVVS